MMSTRWGGAVLTSGHRPTLGYPLENDNPYKVIQISCSCTQPRRLGRIHALASQLYENKATYHENYSQQAHLPRSGVTRCNSARRGEKRSFSVPKQSGEGGAEGARGSIPARDCFYLFPRPGDWRPIGRLFSIQTNGTPTE